MNRSVVNRWSMVALSTALLTACGHEHKAPAPTALPVLHENALATVAGTEISERDVEREVTRMLGEAAPLVGDEAVYDKVLQSLVATRALAAARLAEIDASTLAELDDRVASYRDQLLVEDYLRQHAEIKPVTQADIQSYYEAHPEAFGAKSARTFELLRLKAGVSDAEREAAFQRLAVADKQSDWAAYAHSQARWLEHLRGRTDSPQLAPQLARLASALDEGELSRVVVIDGRGLRMRVTGTQQLPPRALEEVREDIRRILAAQRMREAVKTLSAQVLAQTSVEYANGVAPFGGADQ